MSYYGGNSENYVVQVFGLSLRLLFDLHDAFKWYDGSDRDGNVADSRNDIGMQSKHLKFSRERIG